MDAQQEPHPRLLSKAVIVRAAALTLASWAVLTLAIELVYRGRISDQLLQVEQAASEILALERETIRSGLAAATADLLYLARQNELHQYLISGDPVWRDAIAQEYVAFASEMDAYDQIRFLDDRGREIVRVNYNDGDPKVIPADQLQSKGSSNPCFIRSLVLDAGEVYMSRFDLNTEEGRIEVPWKPVIRFGTPVFDTAGQKRGIMALSYLGDRLLDALRKAGEGPTFAVFLANSDSYWLLGPEEALAWGFMFFGEGVHTVGTSFPGVWERMRNETSGRVRTDDGLFTFTTIDPAPKEASSDAASATSADPADEPYRWKLIVHVPAAVLGAIATPVRRMWGVIHGALALMTASVSFLLARHQAARVEYRRRIEFLAKYDSLTGACNRHFFDRTISDEAARAARYRHPISFLMVDVTRFKSINDTHGHKIGDEVLREVADILRTSVREADVVVRYGGDEFLVMFPETAVEADAARDRILGAVERLNATERFPFSIVLALGSAHWDPDSQQAIEEVLGVADERMYEHKQAQHQQIDAAG
jgi:diguanylate cyclase (GGDEF)-like protein